MPNNVRAVQYNAKKAKTQIKDGSAWRELAGTTSKTWTPSPGSSTTVETDQNSIVSVTAAGPPTFAVDMATLPAKSKAFELCYSAFINGTDITVRQATGDERILLEEDDAILVDITTAGLATFEGITDLESSEVGFQDVNIKINNKYYQIEEIKSKTTAQIVSGDIPGGGAIGAPNARVKFQFVLPKLFYGTSEDGVLASVQEAGGATMAPDAELAGSLTFQLKSSPSMMWFRDGASGGTS